MRGQWSNDHGKQQMRTPPHLSDYFFFWEKVDPTYDGSVNRFFFFSEFDGVCFVIGGVFLGSG